MNVARIKALLWLASLGLAAYLGWYVWDFFSRRPQLEESVSQERVTAVLESVESPPEPEDDVVEYDVVKAVFHDMNWTGKLPAPPPEAGEEEEEETELPKTPISELLAVVIIQVDMRDPERSVALVRYLDPELAAAARTEEDALLRPGEHLAAPWDHVLVDAVLVEGVRFAFEGEEREAEVVPPLVSDEFPVSIVPAGPEGAAQPSARPGPSIARREDYVPFRPERTTSIGRNEFLLGFEDVREVQESYPRILSRDVGYRRHRDPRTGLPDGIEITRVAEDSIPAAHGVSRGEVLKSINGHPVSSVNEAIAFVKKEANKTDTWVAVFEKQGREIVRTYKSPPRE